VRAGEPRWDALRRLLAAPPWPSRAVEDNLADLRAAAAANHAGAMALRELARIHGEQTVRRYMEQLEALAENRVREALSKIPDGVYEAEELLDDGSPLRVRIELSGDGARIDFAGCAPVHAGNLNATPAIVQSAVIYVLRLLLEEPLPLNEGLLRAVSIHLAPGILDPPFPDDPHRAPAVVGGNVETSQRLVDTLLKALGLAACSQGTMNNVIFGNPEYGYYETLGGGCGAGEDAFYEPISPGRYQAYLNPVEDTCGAGASVSNYDISARRGIYSVTSHNTEVSRRTSDSVLVFTGKVRGKSSAWRYPR